MRQRSTFIGTLAAATWLAAAPAPAATITAAGLPGTLPGLSGGASLYAHDSANVGLSPLRTANGWAVAHHSLFGIQLLDSRASFVIGIGAADSEVMRAFKAEDAHLIQEADRGHATEPPAPVAFQVLPAVQWREEPVVDRDLTNLAAQPIPNVSVDPSGVGTVIVATPATAADAEVPPPLEPVVQGGVVALNLMMSAAVSLFERVAEFLHKFLFVGREPQRPAV